MRGIRCGVQAFRALVASGLSVWAVTAPALEKAWDVELRANLEKMAAQLTATLKPWEVPDRICRVEDYGAVADGKTVNTAAINKTIEACAAQGGGVVRFSRGDYVSGTIDLRSGVMLEVARGARLLGSTDLKDYPDRIARRPTVMDSHMDVRHSLIFAEGCDRIGIRGEGIIDGRGEKENFPGAETIAKLPGRPFLIRVLDSRNVVLDGITLRNSASWMQDYLNCENVIIQNVTVENQSNWNNDGVDLDGCRNVIVRHCFLNAEDDALCFKGASLRPTENVLVEDCRFYSTCNAVKFGTDSQGDFRNVLLRRLEIGGPSKDLPAFRRRLAISGISWESVDGATVENVLAMDVHIVRTHSPVFLRLGDRGRVRPEMKHPAPGTLRRVVFENLTGNDIGPRGSIIAGIPGARISEVVVRNYRVTAAGGVQQWPAEKDIPEKEAAYPEANQFGPVVPAHGFWVRHARDVRFDKVEVRTVKPDARPLIAAGMDTEGVLLNGKPLP